MVFVAAITSPPSLALAPIASPTPTPTPTPSLALAEAPAPAPAPVNYRGIAPVYRRFARAAVKIYLNVHAPIEQRAEGAFKLVDDMLTIMVGDNWWARSKKRVSDEKAARMGTIEAAAIVRIAHLAGELPIVDVGFGYGQVIWQLKMIGANVIGGMEMESTYNTIAINSQPIFSRCGNVTLENDKMGPRWITAEPRAYYMNNIALSPKENAALWGMFKNAPVGSKVITTSVMVSVRHDASWQSKYDGVTLVARHSISKGFAYKRGLVCYTRIA